MQPRSWMGQPTAGFNTTWTKRLGLAGFAFFFIKGLLWLTLPLVFYWLG